MLDFSLLLYICVVIQCSCPKPYIAPALFQSCANTSAMYPTQNIYLYNPPASDSKTSILFQPFHHEKLGLREARHCHGRHSRNPHSRCTDILVGVVHSTKTTRPATSSPGESWKWPVRPVRSVPGRGYKQDPRWLPHERYPARAEFNHAQQKRISIHRHRNWRRGRCWPLQVSTSALSRKI